MLGVGGSELYAHRHYKEPVVLAPASPGGRLSSTIRLKGTANDSLVNARRGGWRAVLVLGGTHPGEVAASQLPSSWWRTPAHQGRHLRDTAHKQERIHWNSALRRIPSLPPHSSRFGARKFRMGDRHQSADQWPDPDVTFTPQVSPSYVEIRNINRCWPRPDGTLTEQTAMPRCSSSGA